MLPKPGQHQKVSAVRTVFWVLFMILVSFTGLLASLRFYALVAQSGWRNGLGSSFPAACGDWAINAGCTRVSLDSAGCTRPIDIPTENSLVFNTLNTDLALNKEIAVCIDSVPGAKIMSPSDLESSSANSVTVHVSVNSAVFGFIDDMYIISEPYGATSQQRVLTMQSQLRMGSSDFQQNYNHVKIVLDCLNARFLNQSATPRPCSVAP